VKWALKRVEEKNKLIFQEIIAWECPRCEFPGLNTSSYTNPENNSEGSEKSAEV
jgi:hypothetical protein